MGNHHLKTFLLQYRIKTLNEKTFIVIAKRNRRINKLARMLCEDGSKSSCKRQSNSSLWAESKIIRTQQTYTCCSSESLFCVTGWSSSSWNRRRFRSNRWTRLLWAPSNVDGDSKLQRTDEQAHEHTDRQEHRCILNTMMHQRTSNHRH